MPKATHDPTTSRRHVLAALTGAAFAGGGLTLAMPNNSPSGATIQHGDVLAGATPALNALYAHWREAENKSDTLFHVAETTRSALIERWGHVPFGGSAEKQWGHDPKYAELVRFNQGSADDLSKTAR